MTATCMALLINYSPLAKKRNVNANPTKQTNKKPDQISTNFRLFLLNVQPKQNRLEFSQKDSNIIFIQDFSVRKLQKIKIKLKNINTTTEIQ